MIAQLHRVQVFTMYAMLESPIGLNQIFELETLHCSSNVELIIKEQITIQTNFEITQSIHNIVASLNPSNSKLIRSTGPGEKFLKLTTVLLSRL